MKSWPATLVRPWSLDSPGTVELFPDRIVVGQRTFSRTGLSASVTVWKQRYPWTTLGAAIELHSPRGSLWLGGRGYLLPTRGLFPHRYRVDAMLSAADFSDFVGALALLPSPLPSPGAGDAVSIDLVPTSTSLAGLKHSMGAFFVALAVASGLAISGNAYPLFSPQAQPIALTIACAAVAAIGLVISIVRSLSPPNLRYCLLVDRSRVALCDLKASEQLVVSAAQPAVEALCYRGGSRVPFSFPALRLRWHSRTLVVSVFDESLNWRQHAQKVCHVSYVVGSEEWRRLVTALKVAD